jgi:hydrogenase maturation protease
VNTTPLLAAASETTHSSAPPPLRTLLLGLGNDLLGDDAIGLRVAAALREPLAAYAQIAVWQSAEMGLALLDLIAGFEGLVLVDAIQTGRAPAGFVHELDGDELRAFSKMSPHFLGIGEMLVLGRELGMAMPKQVRVFAIEVQDPFTMSLHLTPTLEAAVPRITQRILAALIEPGSLMPIR